MTGLVLAVVIAGLGTVAVCGSVLSQRDKADHRAQARLRAELRRHTDDS